MSKYIQDITVSLQNIISELSDNPSLFLRNPEVDFSRNRKIDFKTFVGITLNSGGCTMCKELLEYFDFKINTPTVSAYTQQRSNFTEENVNHTNLYHGYKLIACDGSDLCIANNPNDAETSWKCNQFVETANYLHLNAFYDVLNRVYLDAVIQTASEYHEYRACIRMMERSHLTNAILIADRGYENYNIIAHAIQNNWKFVIRVKDIHSNGIASKLDLPKRDVFDTDVSITFTRKNTKSESDV